MKRIQQDELYRNLGDFLTAKGIELKEGSYAQRIKKTCGLLTDAINLGDAGLERAKKEIDEKLEQMRQVIHEKTAPKPAKNGPGDPPNPPPPPVTATEPPVTPATEPKPAPAAPKPPKQTARKKPTDKRTPAKVTTTKQKQSAKKSKKPA